MLERANARSVRVVKISAVGWDNQSEHGAFVSLLRREPDAYIDWSLSNPVRRVQNAELPVSAQPSGREL